MSDLAGIVYRGKRWSAFSFGGPWWESPSPVDSFAALLVWLSWVARGCPTGRMVIAGVDVETGVVTLDRLP